jgi:hypothetical protein
VKTGKGDGEKGSVGDRNPPLCDLWMNLCLAEDFARLETVPEDAAEVEKLLKLGLIEQRGKWVRMTEKGVTLRQMVCA